MKNKIYKIALVLSAFVFAIACENTDDFTGDSVLSPSNPALSVSLDFGPTESLIETEADYGFTVSLSQAQIVDVEVYLELLPTSTATEGADFSFPHHVRIPSGSTSVSDVITIHSDDLIEETETVSIKIGTGLEANVTGTNSKTVNFNILNYTDGDLVIGMDWALAQTITDNFGNEIGVYDAADLRLLLTAGPSKNIVLDGADGGSAETYVLDGAAPDGDYYIVADFYAATDIPVNLDLTLSFDQAGVINGQTHSFPAALNTEESCTDSYTVLAKITKSGTNYSFEEVGTPAPLNPELFVGSWTGTTSYGHPTQMVTTWDGTNLSITGVAVGFMTQDWGEEIVTMETLVMDVNWETGEFSIAEAPYMETLYLGVPQPTYNLVGSGTLSGTCTPTIYLDYDLVQAGTSYTAWLTVGNGWPPFEELNTL